MRAILYLEKGEKVPSIISGSILIGRSHISILRRGKGGRFRKVRK